MILLHSTSGINKHSIGIVPECFSDCNGAGDGSSLVDLVHHGGFALHQAELLHSIDLCSLLSPASSVGHAVLALDHR